MLKMDIRGEESIILTCIGICIDIRIYRVPLLQTINVGKEIDIL